MNYETTRFEINGCIVGTDFIMENYGIVMIHWISYNHVTSIWEIE